MMMNPPAVSSDLSPCLPVIMYMPAFHGGGAENAVVRLANFWHQRGRKVTIIVNKIRGPVIEKLDQGVEVVDLGTPYTALAWPRLGKLLRARRPAFLATALLGPNVAGLSAARLWSPQTAVASLVRNFTTEEIAGRDWLRRLVFPILLRATYRRTDAIGCVATRVSADIVEFAGISADRVETTLNPVPLPDPARSRPRPEEWPTQGPVIVAMGRMVPQKDYPTLLRAFARLSGEPKLLILGDGPLRPELEALTASLGITDRVLMPGFRNQPDNYLAHADVFVLASRFEGFPNVITEALALGRTVVATDAPGGSAEILGDGAFGYLAPVGNDTVLAEALQRGLDRPMPQDVARRRAEEFAVENVATLYESLFAKAIQRRGRA